MSAPLGVEVFFQINLRAAEACSQIRGVHMKVSAAVSKLQLSRISVPRARAEKTDPSPRPSPLRPPASDFGAARKGRGEAEGGDWSCVAASPPGPLSIRWR